MIGAYSAGTAASFPRISREGNLRIRTRSAPDAATSGGIAATVSFQKEQSGTGLPQPQGTPRACIGLSNKYRAASPTLTKPSISPRSRAMIVVPLRPDPAIYRIFSVSFAIEFGKTSNCAATFVVRIFPRKRREMQPMKPMVWGRSRRYELGGSVYRAPAILAHRALILTISFVIPVPPASDRPSPPGLKESLWRGGEEDRSDSNGDRTRGCSGGPIRMEIFKILELRGHAKCTVPSRVPHRQFCNTVYTGERDLIHGPGLTNPAK